MEVALFTDTSRPNPHHRQLEYLEKIPRIAPEAIEQAAGLHEPAATVVPYPRDVARAETGDFPDPRKKILSPL